MLYWTLKSGQKKTNKQKKLGDTLKTKASLSLFSLLSEQTRKTKIAMEVECQ